MEEDLVTQVLSAPSVTRETEIGTLEVKLISKELFTELEKTGEFEYVCPISYGAGDVYCIVANLNSPVFISLKKRNELIAMAFNIPPANDVTIVDISNELRSGNLARILLDCDYHLVEIYLALQENDEELTSELLFEIDGKDSSIDLLNLDRVNLAIRKILRFAGSGYKNVFIEKAEILIVGR